MPSYNREAKRDHNFDNHPYTVYGVLALAVFKKKGFRVVCLGLGAAFGVKGLGFKASEGYTLSKDEPQKEAPSARV